MYVKLVQKLSAWEEAYQGVEPLWGLKPDPILIEYARLAPNGRLLDLGIGEMRNALFLAKMGYEVEGVDISPNAIQRRIERAQRRHQKSRLRSKA